MSTEQPPLERVQRWMQSVIMHRGGVAEAVDSPEVRQYLDVSLDDLERVIRRSQALSSANRLEIYVNAYYARLMECLDEEFAVTRYALGEELFGAVTFGYLQSYPSQSYTLGHLGANFPRYLAESRLHAMAAPDDAPATWADFIAELAALERLLYEVYDGPGTERSNILSAADLATLAPEAWGELRLVAAPCLRLAPFAHPVNDFWTRRKQDGEPVVEPARATRLAIHRRDYVVERRELTPTQFVLLSEIAGGASLSTAIAQALQAEPASEAQIEAELGAWFARWAGDGYFVGFQPL